MAAVSGRFGADFIETSEDMRKNKRLGRMTPLEKIRAIASKNICANCQYRTVLETGVSACEVSGKLIHPLRLQSKKCTSEKIMVNNKNKRKLSGNAGDNRRQEGDFYPTPDYVSDALFENAKEHFSGTVWECACGDGRLMERIKLHLPDMTAYYATDLYDRGYGDSGVDFLAAQKDVDCIITNPPFELAMPFILKADRLAKRSFALLLPIRYMTGKTRAAFYHQNPPSKIVVIPNKVDFLGNGNPIMEFAWFIWDKRMTNRLTTVVWADTSKKSNQLNLFRSAT